MFGSHPVHFILLCLSYLRYISKIEEIYVGNFHLSIYVSAAISHRVWPQLRVC